VADPGFPGAKVGLLDVAEVDLADLGVEDMPLNFIYCVAYEL
jgi:hypothetical protein